MSVRFPVLDKPIDQWKVTELREELRMRGLSTKGLKEELVRRLCEVLDSEWESAKGENLGNGLDPDSDPKDEVIDGGVEPVPEDNTDPAEDMGEQVDNDDAVDDISNSTMEVNQGIKDEEGKATRGTSLDGTTEDMTIDAVPVESSVTISQNTASQNTASQTEASNKNSICGEKNEDSEPSAEDVKPIVTEPNNQVSVVSPDLGLKYESICTDSVSINEKNELKDTLNADNFHLELEVVKPEMVQPSSSSVPTIGGDLHPLDDDRELVDNQGCLEQADDVTCATNVESSKKSDCAYGGSPEKLNLDRSSGDESMEEDVLESRQIESKNHSDGVGKTSEGSEIQGVQVGGPTGSDLFVLSPKKKGVVVDNGTRPAVLAEKRKAEDQEAAVITEPKRQRRWNSENIKVPELQASNLASSTPRGAFLPTLKRSLTRSDSSLSGDGSKERIVPPSQKAATTSLRIDHFLRPFTLKAVQELLAKTGTFTDFWMDHIKTHCYVTYSSEEEATATRNALYNLQWPPNGGRLLVAEFVDPQEVKARLEAPQIPVPVTPSPTTPTAPLFQQLAQTPAAPPPPGHLRQQLPLPTPLPPPPALVCNPPPVRERLPPPPPIPKNPDPPIVTLDDLFKKTRATPRIYYLPLSEEQVSKKVAAQVKRA